MPVTTTYPGVYIEEIPSGVHTITGVATSIAAFFGQAKEGPVNKAVRILSYADFKRTFGPPHPESELDAAVRLFFQNGGTDCYVIRLVKKGTGQKASVVVKDEASPPIDVLKFTAKEIGVWGNELALEVDYNTARPEDTFNLRIYRLGLDGTVKGSEEYQNCSMDPDSSRFPPKLITQQSKLLDCEHVFASDAAYKAAATDAGYSESRRPFTKNAAGRNELSDILAESNGTYKFKISVDGSPFFEVDLKDAFPHGTSEPAVLNNIKTRIDNALPAALKNTVDVKFEQVAVGPPVLQVLRSESATTEKKSIVIQPGSSNDVTGVLMLGTEQGGIEKTRYSSFRPAPSGTFLDLGELNDLSNHPQDHFNEITLDGNTIGLGTSLETTAAADKWYEGYVDAATKNFDGVREKLAIIASAINDEGIGWTASVSGSRLFLKKRSGLNNFSAGLTTSPNDIGSYFKANTRFYSLGSGAGTFHGAAVAGIEGSPPDVASYKGSEAEHTGFYALDLVDLFNLMVIPRDSNLTEDQCRSLWGPASAYCKKNRAFLIIDPPDSWSTSYAKVIDPSVGIRKLRMGVVKDHAAVFYPRIVVRENGLLKKVGPGGAIAGLMSRTDSDRGVWKAPAGTEADIIAISDLEISLTDMENGVLNKEGVNCLRLLPVGIVNWGSRTMDGADDFGSEWKYIPIRRLALFLEESLFRGTKWVVFEPNDEPLWAKIRMNVGAFMMRLFRQGAFQGSTPDKAFFVKCDDETTTQADRDLGIVNIEVGFAPLKPAEFVIIKIQQIAGEL
jgi:phage tail sheath protein FI